MIVLLAPLPDQQLPPLRIACLAPGRQLPHIKHSQWVKDRQVSAHCAPPWCPSYTTLSHPGQQPWQLPSSLHSAGLPETPAMLTPA